MPTITYFDVWDKTTFDELNRFYTHREAEVWIQHKRKQGFNNAFVIVEVTDDFVDLETLATIHPGHP